MKLRTLISGLIALVFGTGMAMAQQSNSAGDASNAQQNGDNHQTQSGGQPGGANGRS